MANIFTGYSSNNNFEEALNDAIVKAKNGLTTDIVKWKLDNITGEDGGFIRVQDLSVSIQASMSGKSKDESTAYFRVDDASASPKAFIIKLIEQKQIDRARAILAGKEQVKIHISGNIVKSTVGYNSEWPFHIDPTTIDFFEFAIEVCDATMKFIEENLSDIGGSTLPNNYWCPWTSKLVKEITYGELKAGLS